MVLDQITKLLARRFLVPEKTVGVIPGFFDFRLTYNDGGAFGIMPDWAPLFIIIALAAIYAIVRLRSAANGSAVLSVGLALLLGGATGNLIDRLFSAKREVTDFISLHVSFNQNTYEWPTFNVADIAIVLGAVSVFYYVYVVEKRRAEA